MVDKLLSMGLVSERRELYKKKSRGSRGKSTGEGMVRTPIRLELLLVTKRSTSISFVALVNCNAPLYADDTVLYCSADIVQLAPQNLQLSVTALALIDLKLRLHCFSRERCIGFNSLHLSTPNGCYSESHRV